MDPQKPSDIPRTGRIILLGSTGSIGVNTIKVVEHLNAHTDSHFEIVGLAAGRRADILLEQATALNVQAVAIADSERRSELSGIPTVYSGSESALELLEAIAQPGDIVVGAMVGAAGIGPTIAALDRGCDVALANKEALVAAGALVTAAAERSGARIIPIDSEHSAIFQCLLSGRTPNEVARLVLTASGGPFRTWDAERINQATVEEALAHPTWSMGPKVTIDSASMMNKALELIEAHWLFGMSSTQLDAIVHPQSIVHSFVEFIDGSVIAQLSPPDMKMPIQYALTWPHRADGCADKMDFATLSSLIFEPVDHLKFPSLRTALEVIDGPPAMGAIFNAANEVAVEAFLNREIPFNAIIETIKQTLESCTPPEITTLDDVLQADLLARKTAEETLITAKARA